MRILLLGKSLSGLLLAVLTVAALQGGPTTVLYIMAAALAALAVSENAIE